MFEWSSLGCYKALGTPNHVYCFLNNTQPDTQAIIVQLWSKNSKAAFYKGSHRQLLRAEAALNGYLEIPRANLAIEGVEYEEINMKEGGRTIIDARVGFVVIQGLVINLGFATKEELKTWATMKVPDIPPIRDRVEKLAIPAIGNNFELVQS
ncbi:hypothetical protein ACLMJK_004883 [Lecanora helva]